MKKHIRSRILENFEPSLLKEIYKVCKSSIVSDNNLKVDTILNLLKQYKKDYVELGPGTNRLAILIDNYVFKIALDKWGMRDNLNEFTMSQELQPYVTKTYETNELICVSEYVTVISVEEFEERKEEIRQILGILAEGYLLGDVGTVKKNFCNWGYRDNGDLVALDFAYIYRVAGDELLCSRDNEMLRYDDNFHNLVCPRCSKKYTFMDIRRKIPMEVEEKENFMAKELSYKVTKPFQEFEETTVDDEDESSTKNKVMEENDMKDKYDKKYVEPIDEEEVKEEAYYDTLEQLRAMKNKGKVAIIEEDHSITPIDIDPEKEQKLEKAYAEIGNDDADDIGIDKEFFLDRNCKNEDEVNEHDKKKEEQKEVLKEINDRIEEGNDINIEVDIKEEIKITEEVISEAGNSSSDKIQAIEVISHVDTKEKEALGVVISDDKPGMIRVNISDEEKKRNDIPSTIKVINTGDTKINTVKVVSDNENNDGIIKVVQPVKDEERAPSTMKVFLSNTDEVNDDEAEKLRKELEADLELDDANNTTHEYDEYEKMYEEADNEKNMGKRGNKKWDV